MKKLLLNGLALAVCFSFNALVSEGQAPSNLNSSITNKKLPILKPSDEIVAPVNQINPTVSQSRSSAVEVSLGQTTYDLQSNYGSVGNRVKRWDDNTISVVWTKGDISPGFTDRGTGYNYFDGSNWAAAPSSRIESFRTGWPNVSGTSNSGEYIVNHGTNPTNFISRPIKGIGSWTEMAIDTTNVTWPRMVVGGANGNTVHVIGNENAGSFYVKYSRSQDGGATWDIQNVYLPDETVDFFEGSVDGYDIDSRGDVVAIAIGGFAEDLVMWKSTDNGSTWTKTTVNDFPLSPFDYTTTISDVDGDGMADTIPTTDSGISLVIDNNNIVHIAVGSTRILNEAPNPTGSSYFPGTDGLLYWNESMPAGNILNNVIAFVEDIDGSGVIELPDGLAIYQAGLTSMSTLGVDGVNNVHLCYSSIIENTTNGNANPLLEEAYRNVYYMYSTDAGVNWSTPVRVEPTDFDEQAWPNMAKKVDNCIHLTYHKDGEPGNTFQPSEATPDAYAPYDVIYNCINNPVGLNENSDVVLSATVYPNPVHAVLNYDFSLTQSQDVTINLVDVLGKTVYSTFVNGTAGINNVKVNVKTLSSGVYSLNTIVGSTSFTQKVVIQ
ncbi:MAG: T9SS type A sorting domain-containing protein [Bacteroidota bacterium]|nr:T9SS type A sorting domain-containing protein [Bacteroidota bacterium]